MRKLALAALLLLASPALAQQPAGPPFQEALRAKLALELNAGLQCNTELIQAQRDLAAAQARIKELEAALAKAIEKPASSPKP